MLFDTGLSTTWAAITDLVVGGFALFCLAVIVIVVVYGKGPGH